MHLEENIMQLLLLWVMLNAYDDLLSIYRKNKNKEISKKQKASIQASIKAFFKK